MDISWSLFPGVDGRMVVDIGSQTLIDAKTDDICMGEALLSP